MPRLIIHAGFPKTGSSSIQSGIGRHLGELNERGFFMFGKDMKLGKEGDHPGLPLWYLEDAYKNWPEGKTLFGQLTTVEVSDGDTLLLTSENLDQIGMPRLFVGIDDVFETHVVFYMRPQPDWIPSAWKQWAIKKGVPIATFINDCLRQNRPACAKEIDEWAKALPKAKITVRPFFRDVMFDGSPAVDFFKLIGFDAYDSTRLLEQVNPSIDYSLLHVLMLNAKTHFDGIHDNELSDALLKILPEKYKTTNIAMLSNEAADRIERHYRDENLYILRKYCGLSEDFYRQHYAVKHHSESYMEKADADIFQRAFGILAEAMGDDWAAGLIAASLINIAKGSH